MLNPRSTTSLRRPAEYKEADRTHNAAATPYAASSVIRAALLALGQLTDPPVQRLMLRAAGLALLVFVLLLVVLTLALATFDVTGVGWLDTTFSYAGPGIAFILALLLFPGAVTATLNLFAERVAELVERKHYPGRAPPLQVSFSAASWASVKLALTTIALNILLLPVYFLLPGANLIVFLALNGYLLGREYFELVAQRRVPMAEVQALKRRWRGRIWLAGAVVAMTLAIPVFNLVAPVVATAFLLHLFERWRGTAGTGVMERPASSPATGKRKPVRDGSV